MNIFLVGKMMKISLSDKKRLKIKGEKYFKSKRMTQLIRFFTNTNKF